MYELESWTHLTQETIDDLHTITVERNKQKLNFPKSRYCIPDNPDVTTDAGLWAEKIYGSSIGQDIDRRLMIGGDRGYDFIVGGLKVDTKGNQHWWDPSLVLYIEDVEAGLRADVYVLVGIDMNGMRGYVAGWATKEEVENAGLKPFGSKNSKYGVMRKAIHWSKLRMLPVG